MASRPIANGNISFGLVSIPVKLFSAARSKSVSFNLLHEKDRSRIQQKIYCPVDDAIFVLNGTRRFNLGRRVRPREIGLRAIRGVIADLSMLFSRSIPP